MHEPSSAQLSSEKCSTFIVITRTLTSREFVKASLRLPMWLSLRTKEEAVWQLAGLPLPFSDFGDTCTNNFGQDSQVDIWADGSDY